VQYLNANHRDICKFTSFEDSNYVTFKNALATAVNDLIQDGKSLQPLDLLDKP